MKTNQPKTLKFGIDPMKNIEDAKSKRSRDKYEISSP